MIHSVVMISMLLAQAEPAKDLIKPIRPFIDDSTFVVVRIDPKGDFSHWFTVVSNIPFLNLFGSNLDQAKEFKDWQTKFLKAGGTDLFLVYGANDFPHSPCLILVGKNPKDLPVLPQFGSHKEVSQDVLVVGEPAAVTVLKERKSSKRPELETALNQGQGSLIQVGFALTTEAKKVFEEIVPELPNWAGHGKVETLTKGLKYLSWSVGAGETVPEKYLFKAIDKEHAQSLKALGIRILQGLKETPSLIDAWDDKYLQQIFKILESNYKVVVKDDEVILSSNLIEISKEMVKAIPFSPAALAQSQNHMKQILLAMHNYESAYGRFPDDIRDKEGKPLLSWRVALLPFLEQDALYKKFKLDEPWDSEHNLKLSRVLVKVYSSPSALKLENKTPYLAVRGKGLFLDKIGGTAIKDILDGTSNSIGLVEADEAEAVIWTKPADLQPNQKEPLKGLTQTYKDRFLVGFLDGSVRTFPINIDPKKLWAMFTLGGGEVIPPEK